MQLPAVLVSPVSLLPGGFNSDSASCSASWGAHDRTAAPVLNSSVAVVCPTETERLRLPEGLRQAVYA